MSALPLQLTDCPPSPAQLERLPANNAMDDIVDAMAAAVADYGAAGGVMVMVVQPGERNAYDQQVGTEGLGLGTGMGWDRVRAGAL